MNRINAEALSLPIYEKRVQIISALRSNQTIVIAGETGSGKTTQLPFFCLDAGRRQIVCTQPRRIAATSIAARVAAQMGCAVGGRVGYRIRFAAMESASTIVRFMTDGMLLAEVERDRTFSRYDTIIIDEAHERSLNIDFLLGYLRGLLPKRPDLKVIISSATIDAKCFSESFGNAPVIEVSGRLFPIEVLYRIKGGAGGGGGDGAMPPSTASSSSTTIPEDEEDYVGKAVTAVSDVMNMYGPGDALVFMPTERDIRETCERLSGPARYFGWDVLPLFSRLTRGEQEAIFNPCGRVRVVVCTNIAETSITVPNIRYVIDTGLARVSRYAPRLRTNRLPIETISRASADQRKGRCGRVRDGVCVRLYTEEEYNAREPFTQPEIKRSNLAGVILTMAAHNMGAAEEFPFIEPPSKQAISEGYAQLKELGALDKGKNLTPLGREMSRFPFAPHVSRMIIAAKKEGAAREVKIIAAALSIVDPRERPFDKRKEADAMHAKFTDKGSDFMTYINIWDAYQSEWETLKTHGGMRRFCYEHFLSYTRMREWHDVHRLLEQASNAEAPSVRAGQSIRTSPPQQTGPSAQTQTSTPAAIHRSLLTGLLANCAYLDKNGKYRAAGGKEVFIFPGSALVRKRCEWIMCHEIVETTRVYARTVAPIEPAWLEELAADFCKRTFDAPFFDADTGCVRATERVTLFGMPLVIRKNALYSRAEPEKAAEIFIREGLVEENLLDCHHKFYAHNKEIKQKILTYEDKLRARGYYGGDDAIFDFYMERLPGVSTIHELNKMIIASSNGDRFLFMDEETILAAALPTDAENYPDYVNIGDKNFALKYAFEPGTDNDGVTLALPHKILPFVDREKLGYLLPALWPDRIKSLLQQLPRSQRKLFIPINESAAKLASALSADTEEPFAAALSKVIKDIYKIDIDQALFESGRGDTHLDLKLEIRDDENNVIIKGGREEVFRRLTDGNADTEPNGSPWTGAFAKYRKNGLTAWPDDDLSAPVDVAPSQEGGLSVKGYPALVSAVSNGTDRGANDKTPADTANDGVDLVLFPSARQSDIVHRGGVRRLLELSLGKDLAWTERDLSFSGSMKMVLAPFGKSDDFALKLYDMIRESVLDFDDAPRTREQFDKLAAGAKEVLRGLGYRVVDTFEESLKIFTENVSRLSAAKKRLPPDIAAELSDDLDRYVGDILTGAVTLDIFLQYPRYLRSFAFMMEKASSDPLKYRQKREAVKHYKSVYGKLSEKAVSESIKPGRDRGLNRFAQMIAEYEISLFAQHIKTLYPISEKRLDKVAQEIGAMA